MPVDEDKHKLLGESDDSNSETFVYIFKEPFMYNRGEQEQELYNVRQNRRQPDRYGLPIDNF